MRFHHFHIHMYKFGRWILLYCNIIITFLWHRRRYRHITDLSIYWIHTFHTIIAVIKWLCRWLNHTRTVYQHCLWLLPIHIHIQLNHQSTIWEIFIKLGIASQNFRDEHHSPFKRIPLKCDCDKWIVLLHSEFDLKCFGFVLVV